MRHASIAASASTRLTKLPLLQVLVARLPRWSSPLTPFRSACGAAVKRSHVVGKEVGENTERELVQASWPPRGKITAAARELGISRPTLYELIEKLGLRRSQWAVGSVVSLVER